MDFEVILPYLHILNQENQVRFGYIYSIFDLSILLSKIFMVLYGDIRFVIIIVIFTSLTETKRIRMYFIAILILFRLLSFFGSVVWYQIKIMRNIGVAKGTKHPMVPLPSGITYSKEMNSFRLNGKMVDINDFSKIEAHITVLESIKYLPSKMKIEIKLRHINVEKLVEYTYYSSSWAFSTIQEIAEITGLSPQVRLNGLSGNAVYADLEKARVAVEDEIGSRLIKLYDYQHLKYQIIPFILSAVFFYGTIAFWTDVYFALIKHVTISVPIYRLIIYVADFIIWTVIIFRYELKII